MIAAPVVTLRQIDKLAANARRPGLVCETAQPLGHLAVMVAAGERRPCFAHGHAHPGNERVAGRRNNRIIAAMTRQY